MTRHGNTCPVMCSQCAGAIPTRISQAEDVIYADDVPLRNIETPVSTRDLNYRRRARR